MKAGEHIAGGPGTDLLDLIRGLQPERCVAVGVDVAKASWRVLASNFLGEVVMGGFTLVADEAGYDELCARLGEFAGPPGTAHVRIGVEAAGHYHEILAGRLLADGYDVVCENPAAVKKARGEGGKGRLKTDDLDAAAICSLVIRGHGRPPYLPEDAVGDLQVAYLGREALVKHRSALRNQITSLLDLIWPGATAKDRDLGVSPILSDILSPTGVALLRLGPDPRRVGASTPSVLRRKLRVRGANPTSRTCVELVRRGRSALAPGGPLGARLDLLGRFLDAYRAIDVAIEALERAEADALASTKGARLPEVVGLDVVSASGYVAFVGDPRRFEGEPARVWRAVGADPARAQSGPKDPALPISREGSAWGRAALMKATSTLVSANPLFRAYLADRRAQGKPAKVARMAAGNKANRLLLRLMVSGEHYDLQHHAKRTARAPNRTDPGSAESPDRPVRSVPLSTREVAPIA